MADGAARLTQTRPSRANVPIRIVGAAELVRDGAVGSPPSPLSRSEQELVETLFEWGVEAWEIALATRQSEPSVDAALALLHRGGRTGSPRRRRPRTLWVDDFLIFLHAQLLDLPNWWETTNAPPDASPLMGKRRLHPAMRPKRERARETRTP